ncbi:antibiotic biosynthesis monooxygenase family protein [Ktedonospora formicarum]|uniref:ABM domain-containing protein n=1 Tax=Ktedonospora formicarum TaxID=2778364 RepID=A0A8J3I0Z6_9CHLR|nr:antibiotic biosynthesis monooxygenase [Ktedonospora formicarum]GHO42909.1 hypothetical protein KSX_10720 [Ktedonospora formicarum]
MHVRTSIIRLKPGTTTEALNIIRDIVLPSAQIQQGFQGAQILKSESEEERLIVMSFWQSEKDLLASEPPPEIHLHLERLGELIETNEQGNYYVFHHI